MIQVLNGSWALFLGIFMLMVGNGLQGTLLGLRGEVEGFSTFAMSIIMSAYFGGFLISSRVVPKFIQRVGHVRVFAALGSMISAVLILYPALVEPWAWFLGRVVIGFCYCGVYITAESWLNDSSSNEDRGKALSLYMIIQMAGIVLAQYILLLGDISGYILFIIPSILVSLSFAPILLSVRPTPMTESAKPMSIRGLIDASPLACFGLFMLGGVFAAQFGMFAVYGSQQDLSVPQISLMISTLYVAAVVCQYPIGWLSDRMDRRILIMAAAALGGLACFLPILFDGFYWILAASFLTGATANPLYALLIAYANDYLDREDMSSAAGGLLFVNGVGAIMGPLILGWMLEQIGPSGYWWFVGALMLTIAGYAAWRMTQRTTPSTVAEQVSYAPVAPSASPVAVEVAQEVYIETELSEQNDS